MTPVGNALLVVPLMCVGFVACGAARVPPPAPISAEPAPSVEQATGDAARPSISAEACDANGGSVVGDIGDGAIHRPDYRCMNGAKPTASIQAAPSGPIAIEGSVCCPR